MKAMRNPLTPFIPRLLALLLGLTADVALANAEVEAILGGPEEFEYDESLATPWIEQATDVPPLPDPDRLQRVDVAGLPPELILLLDTARVTVHPGDRVTRLWIYLRSAQGVENGSYEGYRCATGEYKVYAFANPRRDPPITPSKRNAWKVAREDRSARYRQHLMQDYLCSIRGARSPVEIRQAVRDGKPGDPLLFR
jgi:hypothetical protein